MDVLVWIGVAICGFGVGWMVWAWLFPSQTDANECCSESSSTDCCQNNKSKRYRLDPTRTTNGNCCGGPISTFDDVDVITPVVVNSIMSNNVSESYSPPPAPVAEVDSRSDFSDLNTAPETTSSYSSNDYSSSYSSDTSSSYSSCDSGGGCDSGGCGGGD